MEQREHKRTLTNASSFLKSNHLAHFDTKSYTKMDETQGYWKNVLTILDDYSARNYKREPTTLETVKSVNLAPSLVKRQRTMVLEEYMRLKSIDTKKVDPPPILEGQRLRREKTLVDNPWTCKDQAVRQLANVTRKSPKQRFFPGFSDPKLQHASSSSGHPLRPLAREITRLPTDDKQRKSWHEKRVLPNIGLGDEYGESENTSASPLPVAPLDRGITLLYDVGEKNARINDVTTGDNWELNEKEKVFITKRSQSDILNVENEEYVGSNASGSMGLPGDLVDDVTEEKKARLIDADTDNLECEENGR